MTRVATPENEQELLELAVLSAARDLRPSNDHPGWLRDRRGATYDVDVSERPIDRIRAICRPEPETSPAEKLRIALELSAEMELQMRQNLRRRHPDAEDAQIEAMLERWLLERPGAPFGDAPGQPTTWPTPS